MPKAPRLAPPMILANAFGKTLRRCSFSKLAVMCETLRETRCGRSLRARRRDTIRRLGILRTRLVRGVWKGVAVRTRMHRTEGLSRHYCRTHTLRFPDRSHIHHNK